MSSSCDGTSSIGVPSVRVPLTMTFRHSKPHTWYMSASKRAGVHGPRLRLRGNYSASCRPPMRARRWSDSRTRWTWSRCTRAHKEKAAAAHAHRVLRPRPPSRLYEVPAPRPTASCRCEPSTPLSAASSTRPARLASPRLLQPTPPSLLIWSLSCAHARCSADRLQGHHGPRSACRGACRSRLAQMSST